MKSSRFVCGSGAGSVSGSGALDSPANSSELIVHDFENAPGVDSLDCNTCAPVPPALSTLLGSNICVRQVSPVAVAPLGIPSAKASTPAWSASPGDS